MSKKWKHWTYKPMKKNNHNEEGANTHEDKSDNGDQRNKRNVFVQ